MLLAGGLVLGACSDDDSGGAGGGSDALAEIRQATDAAGSARYEGTVTYPDGRPPAALTGSSMADPSRGQATASGNDPATGTEVRWTDGNLYVRTGAAAQWGEVPISTYGSPLLALYDPFTLLQQLGASGRTAAPEGTETVDGDELDKFVVDTSGSNVAAGTAEQVELLTDDQHRLAAVRLRAILQTIEYRLSDYGAAVSVEPPPEDEISRSAPTNTGEEPTGPYEKVAGGTFDGIPWQLARAPATADGTCWRFDAAGGIAPVASTEDDGATCIAGTDPGAPADEQVQFVADAGTGAPFDVLVAVVPVGSQVRLRFADRTSQALTVDPGGFVVWVGPLQPMAVVLEVTAPDGTGAACGPGPVSEVDDLESLPPDQVGDLDHAPWLCIPAG
jgi:hypothetical protein